MRDVVIRKDFLLALAGLFDTFLLDGAEAMARKTSDGSPLNKRAVESLVGSIKGLAEAYAEKMPTLTSVLVEKATDFADFYHGALRTREQAPKAIFGEWVLQSLRNAEARLAASEVPEEMAQRLRLEVQCLKELQKVLEGETESDGKASSMDVWRALVRVPTGQKQNVLRRFREAEALSNGDALARTLSGLLTGDFTKDLEIIASLDGLSDEDFSAQVAIIQAARKNLAAEKASQTAKQLGDGLDLAMNELVNWSERLPFAKTGKPNFRFWKRKEKRDG